jgi:hypothetical protein
VPLNIRVGIDIVIENWVNGRALYNLLSNYHTRIASLRMASSSQYLFKGREFPCLRLLDIPSWYLLSGDSPTILFCSLPELRSLRLGINSSNVKHHKDTLVPLNDLPSMESLVLFHTTCTSLAPHSPSLTTLMLDSVSFGDTISSPVDFPSLTYLSLYDVYDLKTHINAPCLVTYHEGGCTILESFSTPLPSLVEYGLYGSEFSDSDPTKWHILFPNISRVAIRAVPHVLIPVLDALSAHLRFLLVLRTISVGSGRGDIQFTEDEQKVMNSLIGVRSDVCHMDITLCFEKARPFRIPIFFGAVSHRTIKWLVKSDARTGPRLFLVKAKASQCYHKTRPHSAFFPHLQDRFWPGFITHIAGGILAGISEKERKVVSRPIGNYAEPASPITLENIISLLPRVGYGLFTLGCKLHL